MEPSEYGEVQVSNFIQTNGESIERFMVTNGPKTYLIDRCKSILNVITNKVSMLGQINLSWIDTLSSDRILKEKSVNQLSILWMEKKYYKLDATSQKHSENFN
jgi:hypothetical protein